MKQASRAIGERIVGLPNGVCAFSRNLKMEDGQLWVAGCDKTDALANAQTFASAGARLAEPLQILWLLLIHILAGAEKRKNMLYCLNSR